MVNRLTVSQQTPSPPPPKLWERQKKRLLLWFVPIVGILLFTAYKELQSALAQPKVLFVLGGLEKREWVAANFAKTHPDVEVWVSSGSPQGYVEDVFRRVGVERDRLHLDYQALDTVTNFTTLVDELEAAGVESVYLVTSEDHMRRARVVGEIVFGSRGIVIKPIPVESQETPESWVKTMRDGARALFWVFTGQTGASVKQEYKFQGLDH